VNHPASVSRGSSPYLLRISCGHEPGNPALIQRNSPGCPEDIQRMSPEVDADTIEFLIDLIDLISNLKVKTELNISISQYPETAFVPFKKTFEAFMVTLFSCKAQKVSAKRAKTYC